MFLYCYFWMLACLLAASSAKLGNINFYDLELSLLSNAVSQTSHKIDLQDYSATYVKTVEGSVKLYRPKIFRTIRDKLRISDQDVINNLRPDHLICVIPESKSGQRFWVSEDGLIVLKTIKQYECKTLQSMLDSYKDHVVQNDHSVIASVLGVYRVKLPGQFFSKYYLLSRNAFPMLGQPGSYIHAKYDLKGSTQGRLSTAKSSVKKDVDFTLSGRRLQLGGSTPLFLRVLDGDLSFLQRHGVMDYSLLVSVERNPSLHADRFPPGRHFPPFGSSLAADR